MGCAKLQKHQSISDYFNTLQIRKPILENVGNFKGDCTGINEISIPCTSYK